VLRIRAGARLDIENTHLEHVALFCAGDSHRPGADMHAQPLAGAASEQRGIHRTGTAPIHAFARLIPEKYTFRARVAAHHARGIVVGMVGERLDGHEIA
jgi:hypothetical protein